MNSHNSMIDGVLSSMVEAGVLGKDWRSKLQNDPGFSELSVPWHSRALIGFGAWLSSLLFIGFMTGIGFAVGGFWFFGIILLGLGIVLSRTTKGDFWEQIVLALSLSGQAFLIFGITKDMGRSSVPSACTFAIVINSALTYFFESKTHRFLSIVFVAIALLVLIFDQNIKEVLPLVSPILFFSAAFLLKNEDRYIGSKWYRLAPPVTFGLLVSSFVAVSLSVTYVFPEFSLRHTEAFYPLPWISTALFTVTVLWLLYDSMHLFSGRTSGAPLCVFVLLVGLLSWKAPGLMLSLGVVYLGVVGMSGAIRLMGISFLAIFTTLFFYGTDVSLLTKSLILISTGVTLIAGRKLLLCAK